MKESVVIIETGVANMASLQAAFTRLNRETLVSTDPSCIAKARQLVLPGVGSFSAGMAALRKSGLTEILLKRLAEDRPTLAICLGLQLLLETSAENPEETGLKWIPGKANAIADAQPLPQFGWNTLSVQEETRFLQPGAVYFANSYGLKTMPTGYKVAWCTYETPFIAALEKGNLLACQFHPELSGDLGEQILASWLNQTQGGSSC